MKISGPQFDLAVQRVGGPVPASKLLGIARSTVYNYIESGVQKKYEQRILDVMGDYLELSAEDESSDEPVLPEVPNALLGFSNLDLLAEVARRLAVAERVQQADGGVVTSSDASSTLPQRAGAPGKIGGLPPRE